MVDPADLLALVPVYEGFSPSQVPSPTTPTPSEANSVSGNRVLTGGGAPAGDIFHTTCAVETCDQKIIRQPNRHWGGQVKVSKIACNTETQIFLISSNVSIRLWSHVSLFATS